MAPKLVEPSSWGWSTTPGMDQRPLCTRGTVMTEHTVACRWARSVPRSEALRATLVETTLCEEPVSMTKLRRAPPAKRTATLKDTSPTWGETVTGTVVPCPSVSASGAAPRGPV